MAGFNGDHKLIVGLTWQDEDFIELTVQLITPGWRGIGAAYSTARIVREFAEKLAVFANDSSNAVTFEAGDPGGAPVLTISLAEYDIGGNVACRVSLASKDPLLAYLTQPFELSAGISTEPTAVDRFSRELITMLDHPDCWEATLLGE